jgi:hypothetical protein
VTNGASTTATRTARRKVDERAIVDDHRLIKTNARRSKPPRVFRLCRRRYALQGQESTGPPAFLQNTTVPLTLFSVVS